jgi:hypothetical protein
MDIPRHLRDVYRFPGLDPSSSVRGYPGDPKSIVLALRRRRKKQSVASADKAMPVSTINTLGGFATSPVATSTFTSP